MDSTLIKYAMDTLLNITTLSLIGFAYFLGSIPWGIVLTRIFSTQDLRKKGSGNIGATNVMRVAGKTLGFLTLVLDVLKGALPVYLIGIISNDLGTVKEILEILVTLAAFSGHLYPIFLKFKGGKGVATAAGCFLVLSPVSIFIALLVFILVLLITNQVSTGSVSAATMLPVTIFFITKSWIFTGGAFLVGIMIIISHRANIKRIIAGTEPVVWNRRKDTTHRNS